MKKTLLLVFSTATFLLSFGQSNVLYSPDFTAITMEQDTFNLIEFWNDNPEKYVALEFFFTESQICQETAPHTSEAYERLGCNEHDLVFLSINIGNDSLQCQKYIDSLSLNSTIVSGIEGNGTAITESFEIQSFPTVILMSVDTMITYDSIFDEDEEYVTIDTTRTNLLRNDIWPILNSDAIIDTLALYGINEYECGPASIFKPREENKISIHIYPNPAYDRIKVQTTEFDSEINYQIYDIAGHLILNENVKNINTTEIDINVSRLQKGIYILRLFDGQKTASQKLNIH